MKPLKVPSGALTVMGLASLVVLPGIAPAVADGGATVVGAVSAVSGKLLAGICVDIVRPSDGEVVGSSIATGNDGKFSISGLPSGTFTYLALTCDSDYAIERIYDGDARTPATATTFEIAQSGTTTVDVSIDRFGNEIKGVVHNHAFKPLGGICVRAYYADSAVPVPGPPAKTNARGQFKYVGAPIQSRLEYTADACGNTSYQTAWYKDGKWWMKGSSWATASTISTGSGTTVYGYSVSLNPLG